MTYPQLTMLLQGYLNIDWPDDYADPMGAVDDFAANEPRARDVIGEIETLLQTEPSDEALRKVVIGELYSGYPPEADGWTMHAWLRAVAERVRQDLDRC